jgi:hypothetical protein
VYWQGPSVGFDAGGNGDRTMMLVYNLPETRAIFDRFGGLDGSAYFVGGLGFTALGAKGVIVVPIRTGLGWRLSQCQLFEVYAAGDLESILTTSDHLDCTENIASSTDGRAFESASLSSSGSSSSGPTRTPMWPRSERGHSRARSEAAAVRTKAPVLPHRVEARRVRARATPMPTRARRRLSCRAAGLSCRRSMRNVRNAFGAAIRRSMQSSPHRQIAPG